VYGEVCWLVLGNAVFLHTRSRHLGLGCVDTGINVDIVG